LNFQVEFSRSAARQFSKLPRQAQQRIVQALEKLSSTGASPNARRLLGEEHAWRLRVGDYRIIYTLNTKVVTIVVLRVGHRREIYRSI